MSILFSSKISMTEQSSSQSVESSSSGKRSSVFRELFQYFTPEKKSRNGTSIPRLITDTIPTHSKTDDLNAISPSISRSLFSSPFKRNNQNINDKNCHQFQYLPRQTPRTKGLKTLVLDLDETLLHSASYPISKPDFVLTLSDGSKYYVLKRPYVDEFLERMSSLYEIVIYTAGEKEYSTAVIDALDPNNHISYILYRDHCLNSSLEFEKNLNRLGRDLKDVIFIDNLDENLRRQRENGLLIRDFYSDRRDRELQKLIPFLEYAATLDDVRPVNRKLLDFLADKFHHSSNSIAESKLLTDSGQTSRTEGISTSGDIKSTLILKISQHSDQNEKKDLVSTQFLTPEKSRSKTLFSANFEENITQLQFGKPSYHRGDTVVSAFELPIAADEGVNLSKNNIVLSNTVKGMESLLRVQKQK